MPNARFCLRNHLQSFLLDGSALITGEVDRTTRFETGSKGHESLRDDGWRPDPLILDDQALVVRLREKGCAVGTKIEL
jgi:7,8-dihydropterin-6-yl-methyl-4-(beta-D-ribofuranosyl)aminobenzene 5'-phosphate synthase